MTNDQKARIRVTLGSTGRRPVGFGRWPNAFGCKYVEEPKQIRGKLPRSTGWQPVLPGHKTRSPIFYHGFDIRRWNFVIVSAFGFRASSFSP